MFNARNAIHVQLIHMKHLIEDMGILVPCGKDSKKMVWIQQRPNMYGDVSNISECIKTLIGKEWK
jgi:hypothetical protein